MESFQADDPDVPGCAVNENKGISDTKAAEAIAIGDIEMNLLERPCWAREGFTFRTFSYSSEFTK